MVQPNANHQPPGEAGGVVGPHGLARREAGELLRQLLAVARQPFNAGSDDAPSPDRAAAGLVARLLALNDHHWPPLNHPERVSIDLSLRNGRVRLRIEPTDGFEAVLEVQFDQAGKLLTWKAWSAEPLLTYQSQPDGWSDRRRAD
ncbi:MAG: hypothetical protein ACE5K7_07470 [Phycisphaerae bacterium]